jgi:hypothetical protein
MKNAQRMRQNADAIAWAGRSSGILSEQARNLESLAGDIGKLTPQGEGASCG